MARAFQGMARQGYIAETAGNLSGSSPDNEGAVQDLETLTMSFDGTWLVNEILGVTGPDFPWGIFPFPTVPNGVDDAGAANFGSQVFQISKNCPHPEAAFALIAHLTTGKWDQELARRCFSIPVGLSTEWPVQLAGAKELFSSLRTCYPWAAGMAANPDLSRVITEEFTRLLAGTITANQFVAVMKQQGN
jgi:raffinose/stachyose/melibiose transport system substrate-binding protein